MNPHAPVAQLDRALPSEGKGHTFESCRVRHFGTKLGSRNPPFALEAATSVRKSTFSAAHCADFLSEKENSDSCKVRPNQ